MSGKKRKLLEELIKGIGAMRLQRDGKITLQSHEAEESPGDLKGGPRSLQKRN